MGCACNLKGLSFKELVYQNPKVEFHSNTPYRLIVVSFQLWSQNTSYSQKDYTYQPSLKMFIGAKSFLSVSCILFIVCHVSESQVSYRVRVLRIYPEVFRFTTGQSVIYYKKLGRGKVDAYFNGTLVEDSCSKIRFIYGNGMSIDGFWKKCLLPDHHGTFIVKAVDVNQKKYENYDRIEF